MFDFSRISIICFERKIRKYIQFQGPPWLVCQEISFEMCFYPKNGGSLGGGGGASIYIYIYIWGFPKIRGTILGVPIIRTIIFWALYWGPPF